MLLIQHISSNPLQKQNLALPDGSAVTITLYFRPMQLGWFFNEITYQNFTLQGLRVVNNPNMLNQWRNIIPFGLGCFSTGNREPSQVQDFSSGASNLYILTAAEVQQYAEFLELG